MNRGLPGQRGLVVQIESRRFKHYARKALLDSDLQAALANAKGGFVDKRRAAIESLPEYQAIRDAAREVKEHTLSHLDYYLEKFESSVIAIGGQVHWASTPSEATRIVTDICRHSQAKRIIKGKSMVGEEIAINPALEAEGLDVIETDLGEYIIQLANEPPSHIIAPAVHKTRRAITELFYQHHRHLGRHKKVEATADIVNEAREVLRDAFLSADVGITGANFLIAETGQNVIVTNEGNGDLCSSLPDVHIVTASIEKVVPTLEDATLMLRLLARSATGQEMSCYTSFYGGARQGDDDEAPREYHVVLLDNGRSTMLSGAFRSMLRCIRCGACLNHCPVYSAIGGHAYGWVYPGPMGSVLTPLMQGLEESRDLPNACTLNGRCREVCPMQINLPDMLRQHRTRLYLAGSRKWTEKVGLAIWHRLVARPTIYRWCSGFIARSLARLGRRKGFFRQLPLAGSWTASRFMPAPQGKTFLQQWKDGDID